MSALTPGDDLEDRHRAEALAWLAATDDVFRRVKPSIPPRHLVSYVVPIDPDDGGVLLVADPERQSRETIRRILPLLDELPAAAAVSGECVDGDGRIG